MRELHLVFACQRFSSLLFSVLISLNVYSQTVYVFDEKGAPLTGVEVYSDDFTFAVITNNQGMVSLSQANEISTLNFNYLGYYKLKLSISELSELGYRVNMEPSDELIDEIVIIGRNEIRQEEYPYEIKSIDKSDIQKTHSQTAADALSQHGGVYVQKSQMGGGSPVIRGFEANRVLLVVDGVRMNNAIYRNGHLQNAITINPAMLERMDVIFGPNSLLYGSDALGGVVHFQTRTPHLSNDKAIRTDVRYYSRYASANQEKSGHLDLSVSHEKIGSLTSISYSSYGDLRSGGSRDVRFPDFGKRVVYQSVDREGRDIEVKNPNPNVQVGTAYNQFDLLQKLIFKPTLFTSITGNIQFSTSSNIPRYDNLSEFRRGSLRYAEWEYGPQNRFLSSLSLGYFKPNRFFDKAIIIAAYQKIDEDRIIRDFGNPIRNRQNEDVNVFSLSSDFSKILGKRHKSILSYGMDIQHNKILSKAINEDIFSSVVSRDALSRYASDKNRLTSYGVFATWKGQTASEMINYNAGIRYSRSAYLIKYRNDDPVSWPMSFIQGVTSMNQGLTWSVGLTTSQNKGWQLRSMISTAFRSPNIDDLSKIRINADEITFPNPNLKPEKSYNVEITVAKKWENHLHLSFTTFYTDLTNAIVRAGSVTPDGSVTYVSGVDTLNVVANQNIQDAYLYGFSGNLDWKINDSWHIKSSYNYIRGREKIPNNPNRPFAHIPPVYGQTSISYDNGDQWEVLAVWRYNGMKNLTDFGGSIDNPDLATPIGSLRWSTFNLYGVIGLTKGLDFSIGVENIFDKHYRSFSSGVSASGRNFILSFQSKL